MQPEARLRLLQMHLCQADSSPVGRMLMVHLWPNVESIKGEEPSSWVTKRPFAVFTKTVIYCFEVKVKKIMMDK